MTTTTLIRNGYDSWVSAGSPTSKHPDDTRLRVWSGGGYAFIYFPLGPELRNVTIESATLHLYGRDVWGPATVTLKRITSDWDAATLNWNNQPTVGTTTATLTQSNTADLAVWKIDVTALVQKFASGSVWRGMRLEISDATGRKFNSLNASGWRPYLDVRWSEAPAAPVDLSPSGGLAVSKSRPTLSWANDDSPEGSAFTDFEVQVDPAANSATAWTSGTVTDDAAQFDLSQSDYPGLASGATTQWRVRVRASGLWSAWSDWASFNRTDKGTVAISTPGSTVAEYTPPVAWTTSFTQKAWQIRVFDDSSDADTPIYDTGWRKGTTQDHTIPARDPRTDRRVLRDGRDYRLEVRAWDTVERDATPGDPRYVSATVVFNYADDPTPNRVTSLAAEQVEGTPYVDLTWERDTTPDAWQIIVDGQRRKADIPGADLLVAGTTTSYSYRYKDATPGEHEFRVKPTVNGVTGSSPAVTPTLDPTGVWIIGPDDIDVPIGQVGDDFGSFSMPDRATTFELPQVPNPVRVYQGVSGLRGEIHGAVWTTAGRDTETWANRLLTLKKRYTDGVTLYLGPDVIQARLSDIVVEPSRDGGRTRPVSFSFFQTDIPDWMD